MTKPTDALIKHWTDALPARLRDFAQLSRLDRPVGWRLLLIPCLMGLGLARTVDGFFWDDVTLATLFFVGAVAMRGAGCTWNDILDRRIDAQVARTAQRPIPSGRVSVAQALVWMGAQASIGFVVWLALPGAVNPQWAGGLPLNLAQCVAIAAIPLVALYPLMKRITWWPQIWLGLVFSWGVLVAGAAVNSTLRPEIWLLYAGCVVWTIAYDTIYALQDKEDDALIGVRSSARRLGDQWRGFVLACYCVVLFLFAAALYVGSGQGAPVLVLALIGGLMIWPLVDAVKDNDPASALHGFRRNESMGWIFVALCAAIPAWTTIAPLIGL